MKELAWTAAEERRRLQDKLAEKGCKISMGTTSSKLMGFQFFAFDLNRTFRKEKKWRI